MTMTSTALYENYYSVLRMLVRTPLGPRNSENSAHVGLEEREAMHGVP